MGKVRHGGFMNFLLFVRKQDSWEDIGEEKKDVEKPAEVPKAKPKPKKNLSEKIEEREVRRLRKWENEEMRRRAWFLWNFFFVWFLGGSQRKAREEAERKAKEKEEALTPEERRAEMLRRQKLQEEADLRLAMETFGLSNLVDFSPRKPAKTDKK